LDEEDGVSLDDPRRAARSWRPRDEARLRVAVVRLPHLANFTDFDALGEEPSVDLRYVEASADLDEADVVVLPGSKDTIADLAWLRERELAEPILAAAKGRVVVGICAGMQLLGRSIDDPLGVESGGSHAALGVLDLTTTLAAEKVTIPVSGRFEAPSLRGVAVEPLDFAGYEIHTGVTEFAEGLAPFASILRSGESVHRRDGAIARDGRVLATYVHGVFASDAFRHGFVRAARERAGLPAPAALAFVEADRRRRLDRLADAVAGAVDLEALFPELKALAAR
jgi:adenosylcobyric acid synthase